MVPGHTERLIAGGPYATPTEQAGALGMLNRLNLIKATTLNKHNKQIEFVIYIGYCFYFLKSIFYVVY